MDNRTANFSEKNDIRINNILYKLRTAIPAKIISIDYEAQTLSAQIGINVSIFIDDFEGDSVYQPLPHIKFHQYRGSGYSITIPPKIGEPCWLMFADRNTDEFWKTGNIGSPKTAKTRTHDINDAVALLGYNINSESIPNYDIDGITIRNKDKKSFFRLTNEDIKLNYDSSIIIASNAGITINYKGEDTIVALSNEGIKIKANDTVITINKDGMMINAKTSTIKTESLEINSSDKIEFKAKKKINFSSSAITLNGRTEVKGDFDVKLITQEAIEFNPFSIIKTPVEENTQGTLDTNTLDDFNDFYLNLGDELAFLIYKNKEKISVNILKTSFSSYQELVNQINLNVNFLELMTAELKTSHIQFKTIGAGVIDGNISYLFDVTETQNNSNGVLISGEIGLFSNLIQSLLGKGINFSIQVSGTLLNYQISFDKINLMTSYTELAIELQLLNKNYLNITAEENKLKFITIAKGKTLGNISYAKNINSKSLAGNLTTAFLDNYYSFIENFTTIYIDPEGIETIIKKDFAIKITAILDNITYVEYYMFLNAQFSTLGDYKSFAKLFDSDIFIVNAVNNKLVFEIKKTGINNSIDYFENLETIMATSGTLTTGEPIPIESLNEVLEAQSTASSLKGGFSISYSINNILEDDITIDIVFLKNKYSDYNELIIEIDSTANDLSNGLLQIKKANVETNEIIFVNKSIGSFSNVSYLFDKYEGTTPENPKYFPVPSFLSGTESTFAIRKAGENENDNIYILSANAIYSTLETGAVVEEGSIYEYAYNSADLLVISDGSGASLIKGTDGTTTILNDGATKIKGTQEVGAVLKKGLDAGDDPDFGDPFDGTFTLLGNYKIKGTLKVEQDITCDTKIECEKLTVKKELNAKGIIDLTPKNFDVESENEVLVNIVGSLAVTDNITVSTITVANGAELFGEISVKENIDIDGNATVGGDLNLSGKLTGSTATLTFDNNEVRASKDVKAPDLYVNG